MKFRISSIRGTAVEYQLQPNWIETAIEEGLDIDKITQADDIIQYKLTTGPRLTLSNTSCTVKAESLTEFTDICKKVHQILTDSVFESELVTEISQIELTYEEIPNSHYLVNAIESAFSFVKCVDNNPIMRQYEVTENMSLIFFEKQENIMIEFGDFIGLEQVYDSINLFKSSLSEVQNQDVVLDNLD